MQVEGTVHDGVVVLDRKDALPEGTRVEVLPIKNGAESILGDRLKWLEGAIDDMPADFAAEHDHYIHGTPKRRPQGAE
jgi:hypothetical protein